ncbi:MAG: hypothetical protein KA248_00555 [Kiritimatiellae bacterium]|nr:hypothetical protein [Kiritimatiellia bacterium]
MNRLLCAVLLALALVLPAAAGEPEWDIEVGIDNSIYPSLIIATSTMVDDEEEPDPSTLGDPWGFIGVSIVSPAAHTPVRVEISSGKLIQPSVWEGVLEKKGETYEIFPILKFDYDALLAVRQPFPEVVTARVTVNGELLPEKSKRVPVRSVNDCILAFEDEDGEVYDTSQLIAAYVNENHPIVDQILAEALNAGYVDSFAGYQKEAEDVQKELEAVYRAIQDRGFKYSNITRGSGESATVGAQHIRLIGDQVRGSQANCVEGSVLFASIFRKLEMDPFLVFVPGHMFVGVYLDENQEDALCVETTMLGDSSFEDAAATGQQQFEEALPFILGKEEPEEGDATDYAVIDIAAARQMGVMPIREAAADAVPAVGMPPARRPPPSVADREEEEETAEEEDAEAGYELETVKVKELGAAIQLPGDWETEVEEDSAGDPLFTASSEDGNLVVNIGIMEAPGMSASALLKKYLEGLDMKLEGDVEKLEIEGLPAAVAGASGEMEGEPLLGVMMIVIGDEKAYIVQALASEEAFNDHEDLLVEIISSFRAR